MYCTNCGAAIMESDAYCRACGFEQVLAPQTYYPVSTVKFLLLSWATLYLYPIYWFYRNWDYVRERDGSAVWPLWRGIFSFLWFYPLLNDIDAETRRANTGAEAEKRHSLFNAVLALLYVTLYLVSGHLPDPYWLILFLSVVPLLFAVRRIQALNDSRAYHFHNNSRLRPRHYALAALVTPVQTFIIVSALGLIPPDSVVAGADLSSSQTRIIQELAELRDQETIDYYYSSALLSYEDDGNVVTDERVISYFVDEFGVRSYAEARYDEIRGLRVFFGSLLEQTVILVCLENDEYFGLYASGNVKEDRLFVESIRSRMPADADYGEPQGGDVSCDLEPTV